MRVLFGLVEGEGFVYGSESGHRAMLFFNHKTPLRLLALVKQSRHDSLEKGTRTSADCLFGKNSAAKALVPRWLRLGRNGSPSRWPVHSVWKAERPLAEDAGEAGLRGEMGIALSGRTVGSPRGRRSLNNRSKQGRGGSHLWGAAPGNHALPAYENL